MTHAFDAKRTRPTWKDYGISQKAEGMLSWEWVDQQMAKSRNYWIVSTRLDGNPHAAPVWGTWMDGVLYFSTGKTSVKGRNLAANPRVVVHLESGDDVVIFEGHVEPEKDFELLKRMAKLYGEKYPFKPEIKEGDQGDLWYRLVPHTVIAWLETSFPNTATRWEFS